MPSARFSVRLTPRGGRDAIDGVVEGVLIARVAAAPADGAANDALLRLLARELRVPRTSITIVSGASARRKMLAVEGLGPAELMARWPGLRV